MSVGCPPATDAADPAGEHNYNPISGENPANMFTAAWSTARQADVLVRELADTVNDGNAHYDMGAGGHGITTDCHDGTRSPSSTTAAPGPTTWGGRNAVGVATGMNYKF